jgi:hypothetical protein
MHIHPRHAVVAHLPICSMCQQYFNIDQLNHPSTFLKRQQARRDNYVTVVNAGQDRTHSHVHTPQSTEPAEVVCLCLYLPLSLLLFLLLLLLLLGGLSPQEGGDQIGPQYDGGIEQDNLGYSAPVVDPVVRER